MAGYDVIGGGVEGIGSALRAQSQEGASVFGRREHGCAYAHVLHDGGDTRA
jgi:hypothetical protein